MIPQEVPITPNMVVRHDEGLLYLVEDTRDSTRGYGRTHRLPGVVVVNYTQLEAGSFPIGTKWSLEEDEFRQFFTPENNEGEDAVPKVVEEEDTEGDNEKFYPFSLVLGPSFRPIYPFEIPLTKGSREVREKVAALSGSSSMQGTGQLLGALADGKVRGREVPGITPHIGKGVTFNDPNKVINNWSRHRQTGVGPTLSRLMNTLIKNAANPNLDK